MLSFQDSDFGDLEDSKSISAILMHLRKSNICSHKLDVQEVNVSVSQFTESEAISLETGLQMDGTTALDLWEVVMEVLHSFLKTDTPTHQAAGDGLRKVRSTNSNSKFKKMFLRC